MAVRDGDVALVTGAAGGIGVAISGALRAAGARVALVDVDESGLQRAAGELGEGTDLATFAADLTDDGQVAALPGRVRDEFGQLDILVNNAGVRSVASILDLEPADWRRMLEVDLTAPFVLTRAALPGMLDRGRGKIVNIASMAGLAMVRWRIMSRSSSANAAIIVKKNLPSPVGL